MPPYVNWADWLRMNQGEGQRMADTLAGNVATQGDAALGHLADAQSDFAKQLRVNPLGLNGAPTDLSHTSNWSDYFRQAGDAQQAAGLLGSQGGRAQALQAQFGPGGVSWLDSALTGAAGADKLRQTQAQYGALQQAFGAADAKSQKDAKAAREGFRPTVERVPVDSGYTAPDRSVLSDPNRPALSAKAEDLAERRRARRNYTNFGSFGGL